VRCGARWRVLLATTILSATLSVAGETHAQNAAALRGAIDGGPLARVGRTAGDTLPEVQRRGDPDALPATPRSPRRVVGRRDAGPAGTTTTATGRTRRLAARPAQQDFRSLERPPNTAVPAPVADQVTGQGLPPGVVPRRRRAIEPNPYDPLGLRLGSLVAFPSIEAGIGYDDNALRATGTARKRGSIFARTDAGLRLQSDWSRHDFSVDLRGSYAWFRDVKDADRPTGQGRVAVRLDASRDTAFDVELKGAIDSESPGSPNLSAAVSGRPLTYQTGASLGVTQRFNRLLLSGRALLDRADYEDGRLSNGQSFSQKDRAYTQYGLRGRMGYEVSPGLIPFAEAQVDTRQYDERLNSSFERSSDGFSGRAGVAFEITRSLVGEVSAGYGIRRFDDPRLQDLRGPLIDGALAWSISPLTTLRLRGTTQFEETTLANSAGGLTRRVSTELSHAFLRNLVFTATASYSETDFKGISRKDDTLRAGLGFDYGLTRNLVLRANYAHERTKSNVPGNNLSSNVFLFSLRLQL
jgi:hypothetical protein